MSDIELVIKIPESIWVAIQNGEYCGILDNRTYNAIKNGIQLKDVKAEIEQEYNRLSATRADETLELGECLGLKMSLKIIDKYKAESEVTK